MFMETQNSLMATPDKDLDDLIRLGLETQPGPTIRRKKAAWERLKKEVTHQVVLAPYAVLPARYQARPGLLRRLGQAASEMFTVLLVDESRFQRAAVYRPYHRVPLMGIGHVLHTYPITTVLEYT